MEHTIKLIEVRLKTTSSFLDSSFFQVANVVCTMSDSIEGIKLVRLAAKQIEILAPQVWENFTQKNPRKRILFDR